LGKVNYPVFSHLIHTYYGIELSKDEQQWFSLDGKELRGSILQGAKRGEAVVHAVSHQGCEVVAEGFYCGAKESEIPAVRKLLNTGKLEGQKVAMDALHLNPKTLMQVNAKEGIYLVGLKENQQELCQEMTLETQSQKSIHSRTKREKGHGRLERRSYECFDVSGAWFDKRWENSGIQTLVRVEREREVVLSGNKSLETSHYLSNMLVSNDKQAEELFDAIRNHWQVEVSNNCRDCILAEDSFRCINTQTNRSVAVCRTLTIKLLQKADIKNKCAQMDKFADDFNELLVWLRKINFF